MITFIRNIAIAAATIGFTILLPTVGRAVPSPFEGNERLNLPIRNVRIEARGLNHLLTEISSRYDIPIGLEFTASSDGPSERVITIDIESGVLRDVFDSIVSQNSDYVWEMDDEVVNVFPRESFRDPIIAQLLAAKIDSFSIKKGSSRFTVRQRLVETEPVKSLLAACGISVEIESFLSRDFGPLGREYSLEVTNLTLKSILNRIVRESETRYWVVNRFGVGRGTVVVNL